MWITVENKRKSGDMWLGISKERVKGFMVSFTYPQSSPQLFKSILRQNSSLKWKEFCNYKKVISFTHISPAVITTNFIYKTFLLSVPFSFQEILQQTQGAI
jgi:hypothetical protein